MICVSKHCPIIATTNDKITNKLFNGPSGKDTNCKQHYDANRRRLVIIPYN